MRPEQEADFRDFAAAAIPPLRRLAVAVARDPHHAEDLVQTTLEKMYVAWPRLSGLDAPIAYARTTLVRSLIDDRRRWWSRAVAVGPVPEHGRLDPGIESVGEQGRVLDALRGLTPRQRAVVVLRHLDGLDVATTAAITGLSESNVKAATREGLAALRVVLAGDEAHPSARYELHEEYAR